MLCPSALSVLGLSLAQLPVAERAISFAEALAAADRAPAVEAARRADQVKRALDARIPGITQNPQLSIQPGYRLRPSENRQPELIVDLVQPWNLGRLGKARRHATRLEEDRLAAEARAMALTQRLDAARAWIDAWAARRVLDSARAEAGIAAELAALTSRASALGALTRADDADARAFSAEAKLAAIAAEGELHDRGLELARETSDPRPEPLITRGALPHATLPLESEWGGWLLAADRLPAVAARALEVRAERARAVEERASRATVLQLGGVLQRDAPGGLVISGLVRLYPALFDRGQRASATREAEAERIEGSRGHAARGARAELALAMHEVAHSAEVLQALERELVPSSREGAETRRRLFRAGETTLLEVLQAERVAVSADRRLQAARAAHAWSRIKLWLLLTTIGPAR